MQMLRLVAMEAYKDKEKWAKMALKIHCFVVVNLSADGNNPD